MKNFLLLAVPGLLLPFAALLAEPPPAKEPDELGRLRNEYLHRRADLLRPLSARYQADLEVLLRRVTQAGDLAGALLVKKELDQAREPGAPEAGGDLKKALLETHWSWVGKPGGNSVEMTFNEDGTVSHIGMHGTWQITGPREILLLEAGWKRRTMHFDTAVSSYEEIGGTVHGKRWK